ncbi:MRG-domain-containing protein [Parasitella parasitica]|nr:MRG-domain-containing protein [Parasitella parasitica]
MAKEESSRINFEKDEKVLCYHGPFIYEAKILKREKKEEEGEEPQESYQYFVHYKGWKQTWDEWITEDRVLKFTESNLQKQKQLKEINSKRKPSRPASTSALHDASELRSRKRNRDSSIDKARLEEETKKPDFKLAIPDSLKGLLVDDWEHVTKNRQIHELPREFTVDKILNDFKESRSDKGEVLDEYIRGIQLYFNKTLHTQLLYRSEHEQYDQLFDGNSDQQNEPSSMYGAEHLLRLFVEMPGLVVETYMDAETLLEIKEKLEATLRFIQDHERDYFGTDDQYSHAK